MARNKLSRRELNSYFTAGLSVADVSRYVRERIILDPSELFGIVEEINTLKIEADLIKTAIYRALIGVSTNESDLVNILKSLKELSKYLNRSELSEILKTAYSIGSWRFFTLLDKDFLSSLYPKSFEWDMADEFQRNLFVHLYGNHSVSSFDDLPVSSYFSTLPMYPADVVISNEVKSAGFACGGAEKNYFEAAKEGKGLVLVNGSLLAKFFHRRAEALKVTLVSRDSFRLASNGQVLWSDCIYAPSNGAHNSIIDAINVGQTELTIPDLVIKHVRPYNGSTMKLYEMYGKSK